EERRGAHDRHRRDRVKLRAASIAAAFSVLCGGACGGKITIPVDLPSDPRATSKVLVIESGTALEAHAFDAGDEPRVLKPIPSRDVHLAVLLFNGALEDLGLSPGTLSLVSDPTAGHPMPLPDRAFTGDVVGDAVRFVERD